MADVNQAVADLATQMNNLINALQPILTGTAPAATTTFATTPGTHNVTSIIDYSTRTGTALYEEGIKSLYDDKEKFDLQNDKATGFIDRVKARAKKMGWDNEIQGITTYQVNGRTVDLIKQYGLIDITEIHVQSQPWYLHNGAKADQRAAQNNAQFYEMLMNSVTPSARDRIKVYEDEHMLSDGNTPPSLVPNAAALYKVIMRLTTLDSKSTSKALRDRLKDLPAFATTCNDDINLLHSYFFDAYNQLKARGEDMHDKEALLFQAYKLGIRDYKFVSYMTKKEEDWYDGTGDMQGTDYKFIIKRAKEKYDQLKADTHYEWGAQSPVDHRVFALQAEISNAQNELQSLKQLTADSSDDSTSESSSSDDSDSEGDDSEDESEDESIDSNTEDAPAADESGKE
jgi:hypothetical protein